MNDDDALDALRYAFAAARARSRAVVEAANRHAYLVVHPDDEETARAALDRFPEEARPRLVVSATVPAPGTAYYSRPMPIRALNPAVFEPDTALDPLDFLGGSQ